jgi:hypothetical protein
MSEAGALLPGERLAPDAEGSFMIHEFIERIEQCLIVDVKDGLKEVDSCLFLIRIIVVLLKLERWEQTLLEFVENCDGNDEGRYFLFFLRNVVI